MTEAMKKTLTKPGTVLSIVLGAIALGALVAASAMMLPRITLTEPTSDQLAVALYQAGLDPEALTAAGVQEGQIATLVAEADEVLTAQLATLILSQADLATATNQVAQLKRAIRAGIADENAVANLATAQSNANTARSSIDAIHDALFDAATEHLDPAVVTRLETIAANRRWDLPIQYTVNNRTEAQWVALRNALANIRICDEYGEDPHGACVSLVNGENADESIAQATSNLGNNLANVTTAFDSAILN